MISRRDSPPRSRSSRKSFRKQFQQLGRALDSLGLPYRHPGAARKRSSSLFARMSRALDSLNLFYQWSRLSPRQKLAAKLLLGCSSAPLLLFGVFRFMPSLQFVPASLGSLTSAGRPGVVALSNSPPPNFARLRRGPAISACETLVFESSVKQGQYVVEGFGIINASKGEAPLAVYVEIINNGRSFYAAAESKPRPEIVKEFSKPSLLYSGYKVVLPVNSVTPPFEVKSFLVFDDTSFPCVYKAVMS